MREISPELVLVDPELAAVERLRLAEDAVARSVAPARVIPPLAVVAPQRFTRAAAGARRAGARTMPTLLLLSLLLNLLFAASLFAGDSNAPTLENAPPASNPPAPNQPTQATKTLTKNLETTPAPKQKAHPFTPAAKADAERAVLKLVAVRAANRNAPKALVDPTTGLLRNNVLAVCQPDGGGSFACVVHPPQNRPRGGLHVRYWPAADGRPQRIAWLGYRVSG